MTTQHFSCNTIGAEAKSSAGFDSSNLPGGHTANNDYSYGGIFVSTDIAFGVSNGEPFGSPVPGSRSVNLFDAPFLFDSGKGQLEIVPGDNVMKTQEAFSMNPRQPQLLPVCFHNHSLYLVEHDQEPYVPMRPVVDGMGLDWKSQYAKMRHNKERWATVVISTTVAGDNKKRQMVSMPLRKLPGYICSINPNKVRREAKGTVVLYQNECDDVLWDYWNSKVKKDTPALPTTITPPQQRAIQKAVRAKVASVGGGQRQFKSIYTTMNDYFNVPRYTEISHDKFDIAIDFIDKIKLEPIKKEAPIAKEEVSLDSLIVSVLPEISRETKWSVLCMMSSHLAGVKHDINYKY